MKSFPIGHVLTATTGRLVTRNHVDGMYEIFNFLTGDNLYTHQIPRAMRECQPWLKTQFPQLMEDDPDMKAMIVDLDKRIKKSERDQSDRQAVINGWVEDVRVKCGLPEIIPVYEMGADMHTHIDPIEEARAMVGDNKVIIVNPEESNE